MRKTKEEAQNTKQKLLDAAFKNFYEYGFDASSLEAICRSADVTRGAAYWHFKNKKDLFYNTILNVLEKMHFVKQSIITNPELTFKEKITELLVLPNDMSELFGFINKTTVYISDNNEFKEISELIEKAKIRLYSYFLQEARNLKKTMRQPNFNPEELAILLFTLFEGTHNCKLPAQLETKICKTTIVNYVDMILYSSSGKTGAYTK